MTDLKALMAKRQEKETEETCRVYDEMNLRDLGREMIKFGTKHKGNTFRTAYEDNGFVKWMIDRYDEGKPCSKEIKAFMIYVARSLKKDAEDFANGDLPDTAELYDELASEGRGRGSDQNVRPSNEERNPTTEAGAPTMEEIMTGEVKALNLRTIQLEGELMQIHLRMNQLEQALQEILYFIQNQQNPQNQTTPS